jgi:hypothetical protein
LNVSVNDQGNTGLGGPLTDSGSIAITITPVNDPPIAGNAQYQATTGVPLVVPAPGLLAFAFDVDSPVLTVVLVEGPPVSAGTLDLRPDGSFTFTPAATFSGTVTFRYQVSDGEDLSNIATVTINVAAVRKNVIAVGAGAGGGPNAKLIDAATGQTILSVMAYDPLFAGGVRVAVGDVNGDGIPDLITAPGFGGGPHVKVFDGATGAELRSFMAYTPNFSGGLFIAAADVNGDGFVDIITGAGFGGGPHVQVFSGRDGSLIHSFFAFAPELTSGVIVAAGDIDGDGRADIIVGAGPGGGPHVVVFRGTDLALLHSFFAYNPAVTGGVHVAAGDVNGDGIADIITGSGNGSSHVQVFDGRTLALLRSQLVFPDVAPPLPSPQILSLLTTDRQPSSSPETPVPVGGVQVAFATNADNLPLIVAGAPAGQSPRLRAFGASGIELDLLAYDPAFLGGVFVG